MRRFKNVYFYIGIIGLFLTATGVNPQTLTSWQALFDMLKAFFSNPYMIASFVMALIGIIVDPTTKGWKDGLK